MEDKNERIARIVGYKIPVDQRSPRVRLDALIEEWNSLTGEQIKIALPKMQVIKQEVEYLIERFPELIGIKVSVKSYDFGPPLFGLNFYPKHIEDGE